MAKRVLKLQEDKVSSWDQALESYLAFKKAEGKSARTIRDYSYHVKLFFKRFPEASLNDAKLLKQCVINYMSDDVSPAYYNNKLVYLKTFFSWCVNEEIIKANPLKGFKRRRADPRIVQLEADVIKKLLSLPNQKTFSGLRDYALILFQLDTGIRPEEALSLRISEINYDAGEVYVLSGSAKSRIARTLPICNITAKAIQKLVNARPRGWNAGVPIFCTCEGKKMLVNSWYKRVSQYGQQIGTNVFPYKLRHTFALEFLRNGGNAFALQKTLGHADLNMTKRYVALADQDIKEQHMKASPVKCLLKKLRGLENLQIKGVAINGFIPK